MSKKENHNYIRDFLYSLKYTLPASFVLFVLGIFISIQNLERTLSVIIMIISIIAVLMVHVSYLVVKRDIISKYKLNAVAFTTFVYIQWLILFIVYYFLSLKIFDIGFLPTCKQSFCGLELMAYGFLLKVVIWITIVIDLIIEFVRALRKAKNN